ncbi:SusD/RagB family nutrient-binding outer membrane lipoprotein [Niabella beijingensis]|uniref:SusD/RagB family nutrient-binding outer membrane lipoprotein n=1 Tax=Niabella beijingensis TaxID=2872700 RepID=UPI001CBA8266|nr:SusD/RagB family nutrient-binding outer membrane lipoprotein [Niabella beijingensis]MBZ4189699.1 SusD/RagB family nutrient-binding outer membrane lipoprotein [Niabella beijingensis]
MKKILLGLITMSLLFSSCKKNLDNEFFNPENYDKTGNLFGGLFTRTMFNWKIYVQDYGEYWWEIAGSGAMGVLGYTQVSQRYITNRYDWFGSYDDLSGTNGFGNATSLWQGRLGSFYTGLNTWAVMKDNLTKVSGQELDDNQIYFELTSVIKDYAALLAVDFYNSIPYSEAFKGSERVFFPKYDDPKGIYVGVLDELKRISEELPAVYDKMSASAKATFNTQDIAFKGDLNKWIQYINAIRLKYALRISGVEEQTAKTHIQDVLSKNNLPAADMVFVMPYALDPRNGGEWVRGLNEGWPGTFIPDIIMRRMNKNNVLYEAGTDDPRLPVIAFPTNKSNLTATPAVGAYQGVNMNADGQKPGYDGGERYYTGGILGDINEHLAQNSRSLYNFVTITLNDKFPVYMMSLAEVDLLLAEIAAKNLGSTGKSAGEHVKDAITHSTDFWYARNAESSYVTNVPVLHPGKPSSATIAMYADSLSARVNNRGALEEKMELIMQQKFIHLNVMCPYELWTEQRRTRHPKLEPLTFNTKVMKPFPERLRYPTAEQQNNPDNYNTVKGEDNFTSPIFWVPQNLRTVNPYWDNYNYE